VRWENSTNTHVIDKARKEIARCIASRKIELGELHKDTVIFSPAKGQAHPKGPVSGDGVTAWEVLIRSARPEVVNAFLAEHAPPVLDPFCGGGSIPLEAQRLGLRAYASDLNPVAVLITKALIEIPPKFAGRPPVNPDWQKRPAEEKAARVWHGAEGLAEDVRYYGRWMRDEAEKRIGHLYPKVKVTKAMARERPDLEDYVGQELTVIAWLWARTVPSPNPATQGAHVPLVRSFWLSTKAHKKAWVEPVVDISKLTYRFEVRTGKGEARAGTVGTKGNVCLLTGSRITREQIRSEASAGRMGARLMAIVAEGQGERVFLPPDEEQERTGRCARLPDNLPETDIVGDSRYLTPTSYGMTKHRNLFTSRQLVALSTFCDLVEDVRQKVLRASDGDPTCADAVTTYLALAVGKLADNGSALCSWHSGAQHLKIRGTFGRQALSMAWDYAEGNAFSDSTGNFFKQVGLAAKVVEHLPAATLPGFVTQLDAAQISQQGSIFSTDPP
jgi:putative DNA methylase